jgi:hypothetical protein
MTEDDFLPSLSNEELLNQPRGYAFAREIVRRAAPFRGQIETVASRFKATPVHGAGTTSPPARERTTWFLQIYVVAHGRMPRGKARVKFPNSLDFDMGVYDFDILAQQGPFPAVPVYLSDP